MPMTTTILSVLALYMFQIFIQEVSSYRFSVNAIVGNRDTPPDLSMIAARIDRAKNNMLEALPFFLGLALLTMVKGVETGLAAQGAMVFLIARVLYVPVYISGLSWVRSLVWIAGVGGLLMMAAACL